MPKQTSDEELQAAVDAFASCGSKTQAAQQLGIPRTTLNDRLRRAEEGQGVGSTKKFQVKETGDDAVIWSVGDAVRTVDDAIAKAEIDLKLWNIVDKEVNSWPTTMKLEVEVNGAKVQRPETIWNWQVKVKLKRKAPKIVQDGIAELLKEMPKLKLPKVTRKKKKSTHLMEVSLYDVHFGKLCWGEETYTDYDLGIAESDYVNAVDELLELNMGCNIDHIVIPMGNDFFQVDSWAGLTEKGTRVDSVDDRFTKVFIAGCRAVHRAILRSREVGTVDVVWVPGNHDPATSWYLCHYLSALFKDDKHVRVHIGPAKRKYINYGQTLLGYAHGDSCKLDKLPLIMATDEPVLWGECQHRAWRTGHLHTKKRFRFSTVGDTFNGVQVDVLPSISGTDAWHFEHGFVGNSRTAECWIWGEDYGYRGHQSVATRSQRSAWDNPVSMAIKVGK